MVVLILATGFAPLDLKMTTIGSTSGTIMILNLMNTSSPPFMIEELRVGLASLDQAMRSSGTPSCIT